MKVKTKKWTGRVEKKYMNEIEMALRVDENEEEQQEGMRESLKAESVTAMTPTE